MSTNHFERIDKTLLHYIFEQQNDVIYNCSILLGLADHQKKNHVNLDVTRYHYIVSNLYALFGFPLLSINRKSTKIEKLVFVVRVYIYLVVGQTMSPEENLDTNLIKRKTRQNRFTINWSVLELML